MGSTENVKNGILHFGEFELDPGKRILRRTASGETVALTPRVFDTLLCLVEHSGEVVDKRTLLETVWPNVIVEENNLTQAISTLRRALGERPQEHRYILTVPGRGYRFVAEVRQAGEDLVERPALGPATALRRRMFIAGIAGGAVGAAWLGSRLLTRTTGSVSGLFTDHARIFLPTGNHTEPTLSPEGSRVAFVSDLEGGQRIFVKVIGGGDPRPITSGPYRVSAPSWSPRNDEILFTQFDEMGFPRAIRSVDPQGTGESRLVVDYAQNGSFSADGSTIVFDKEYDIWLANADGSNQRLVEGVPDREWVQERARPALSPDGQLIAFYHQDTGPNGDIWLIPAVGGDPRPLTRERCPMGRPVFGPDDRHVYFSAQRQQDGPWAIWRVPIAGGEPEAVTTGPGDCRFPSISADGAALVYINARMATAFKVTDPVSGATESLPGNGALSYFPTISRDGTQFAFFSEVGPHERLFVQNIDGSGLRQITDTEAGVAHIMPGWGPDDSFLYFYEEFGDGGIMRVSLVGGTPTPFFPDLVWGETMAARMSPSGDRIVYRRNSDPPRVVIRTIATGDEQILGEEIVNWPSWSGDGRAIIGTGRDGIAFCDVASGRCRTIFRGNGRTPLFSADESRIFFTGPIQGRSGMHEIWTMGRDGSDARPLIEIGPVRNIDGPFQVTADDRILWNEYAQNRPEIWVAARPG